LATLAFCGTNLPATNVAPLRIGDDGHPGPRSIERRNDDCAAELLDLLVEVVEFSDPGPLTLLLPTCQAQNTRPLGSGRAIRPA
jgi:hypothetical protein